MVSPVDFTSEEFFRDPARGIAELRTRRAGRRDAVSDRRPGLDHHHL